MGLAETLRRYAALLTPQARREFAALCALAALAGLLETGAVAAIVPFLALLADPGWAHGDSRMAWLKALLPVQGSRSVALIGAFALIALVVANAFSSLAIWRLLRFANRQGHALSVRLLAGYLAKPYVFYLDRHTAELQKNLFTEVHRVTVGVLLPAAQIAGRAAAVICIAGLLVIVDPLVAAVVAVVLGGAYALLFKAARATLHAAGQASVGAGSQRARHAMEALAAAKEIKLLGREAEFVRRFAAPSLAWADAQTAAQALGQLPRYAVETVALGLILALAVYLLGAGRSGAEIFPLLGLYAFAGYRLMPALQQVFAGLAAMRSSQAALEAVLRDLPRVEPDAGEDAGSREARIPIRGAVELAEAYYRYPGEGRWALQPVSLRIAKNTTVALVGATGCGKTTVVDLLMGLLRPDGGSLRVDGVAIDEHNVRAWQRGIGHVPQHIFLCDDTIARNIALGVPDGELDMARVQRAAELARLDEFVAGLSRGYDTVVGERGVRLSGGQRQRIGIARALYPDPELLVLDEATSALDGVTESAVLEALQALAGRRTIVMVAHRLSTVRNADLICVMEQGRIVERGSYEELMGSSPRFRSLAVATPGVSA